MCILAPSQVCRSYAPVHLRIITKIYMVINIHLVSLSLNFHEDSLFFAEKLLRPCCTFLLKVSLWKYPVKNLDGKTKHFYGLQQFFSVNYMSWSFKKKYCGHQHLIEAKYILFKRMTFFPNLSDGAKYLPKNT